MNTEPIAWPTSESEWWWMRFRMTPRSKWRLVLVTVIERLGTEYASLFQRYDCLPRTICEGYEARFLPAEPPPSPEDWTR